MKKTRCNVCNGSGKVMGGGMMIKDCDECDGLGYGYLAPEYPEEVKQEKVKRERNKKEIKG